MLDSTRPGETPVADGPRAVGGDGVSQLTRRVAPRYRGILVLAVYIASIGVATYLMKVALSDLTAFQINLLMGLAMLGVSVPAVLIGD